MTVVAVRAINRIVAVVAYPGGRQSRTKTQRRGRRNAREPELDSASD